MLNSATQLLHEIARIQKSQNWNYFFILLPSVGKFFKNLRPASCDIIHILGVYSIFYLSNRATEKLNSRTNIRVINRTGHILG